MGIRIKILRCRNPKLYRTAALRLSLRARRCNRFDMRLVLHRRRMNFWERAERDFGRLSRRLAWAVSATPTITARNFRPLMRRGAVAMLILGILNSYGLAAISKTAAYFNDNESSTGNTLAAGTLDFNLTSATDFPEILPTVDSLRAVTLSNLGSLDFTYQIEATNQIGDLCDVLQIKDDLPGSVFQSLTSYQSATTTFSALSAVNFTVHLNTADSSYQNKSCQFDLLFTGWQNDFPDSSTGFSSVKTLTNTIRAGKWVTSAGDVVINELMWMGSSTSTDEWLELRNMTDNIVDISSWQLTKKSSGTEVLMLTIPAGKTIAPNGFFLISDYDQEHSAINVVPDLVIGSGSTSDSNFALANTNLQIKLYKDDWTNSANLIDTADDGSGSPAAGSNGSPKESMERNDTPGDGTVPGNWHSCDDISSTVLYWDIGRTERGTPGAANLSANDPTAPDFDPSLIAVGAGLLLVDPDVEGGPSMPTDPQATAFPASVPATGLETTPESLGSSDSGGNEDLATESAVDETDASTTDATITPEVLPSTTPNPAAGDGSVLTQEDSLAAPQAEESVPAVTEPPAEPAILPEELQPAAEPQTPPAITTEIVPAIESAPAPAAVEPPAVEVAPPVAQNPAPAE